MHGSFMFICLFDKYSQVMFLVGLRIAQANFCSIFVKGFYKRIQYSKISSHTKIVVWFEKADRIHRVFAF